MTAPVLAQALRLMRQLVAFETESHKTNLPLIDFVRDYLGALGVPCVIMPNAAGDKAALFATIGPMRDGGVVLSGHTDVVPVTGQAWTHDPFLLHERDQRLYGRGSCDMKGFAAIALAMVPEFLASRLQAPVHLLLSYDEETTCLGPVATIARMGVDLPRPRAVIVGEPTMMQVANSQKSIATYVTTVHGHEAHSAKPALGANAIEHACDLVRELYRLDAQLAEMGDPSGRFDPAQSTISVGTIHGGTARNILAKQCAFHWEFRGLPGVAQNWAVSRLDDYAATRMLARLTRHAPAARIETVTEIEIPGLASEPDSLAESLAFRLAQTNQSIAVAFATEAGRFQQAGISTIVCGPGSIDQAHQPDEYIALSQVEAGIVFMQRLAAELG